MPPKRNTVNPEQGSLVQQSMYGDETVPPETRQFTRRAQHGPEEGVSADLVKRNGNVMELLGELGVIAETAPYAGERLEPAVERNLKRTYGSDWHAKAEALRGVNEEAVKRFDGLFKEYWGFEETKKAGVVSEEAVQEMYSEDKDKFTGRFSKSDPVTTRRAKLNRANYRRRLRRQEGIYRENNLGDWPTKKDRR